MGYNYEDEFGEEFDPDTPEMRNLLKGVAESLVSQDDLKISWAMGELRKLYRVSDNSVFQVYLKNAYVSALLKDYKRAASMIESILNRLSELR